MTGWSLSNYTQEILKVELLMGGDSNFSIGYDFKVLVGQVGKRCQERRQAYECTFRNDKAKDRGRLGETASKEKPGKKVEKAHWRNGEWGWNSEEEEAGSRVAALSSSLAVSIWATDKGVGNWLTHLWRKARLSGCESLGNTVVWIGWSP